MSDLKKYKAKICLAPKYCYNYTVYKSPTLDKERETSAAGFDVLWMSLPLDRRTPYMIKINLRPFCIPLSLENEAKEDVNAWADQISTNITPAIEILDKLSNITLTGKTPLESEITYLFHREIYDPEFKVYSPCKVLNYGQVTFEKLRPLAALSVEKAKRINKIYARLASIAKRIDREESNIRNRDGWFIKGRTLENVLDDELFIFKNWEILNEEIAYVS